MTQRFLPEGRLLTTKENRDACAGPDRLRDAMRRGDILEGMTLLCGPGHDLTVQVGEFTGSIPREEAALGIAEGTTREIAILSRVGKPICFTVESVDGGLILSRRRAQERALAHILDTWRPGDVIPATVTHLEPFGAFVDVGCGIPSLLSPEQISVSRISHPRQRFDPGDEIFAVVTGLDPDQGRVRLSHKALLGTWAENAALFTPGMTVPGIVRGVKSYGVFVELTPNLTGLAEPCPGLEENQRVSVYVKAIQPDKRKVKLLVIDRLSPAPPPKPRYFVTGGHLDGWRYLPGDAPLW